MEPSRRLEIVRRIATWGLTGDQWSNVALSKDGWRRVAPRLHRERLTGLASMLHEQGLLTLDDESAGELRAMDARNAAVTLRAEDAALETASAFSDHGIPSLVLKGVAHAELTWSLGEARRWVDADLLVPGEALAEAVELCLRAGAQRPVPELRPGFDRRFAKSVTLLAAADGPELDLHRTLAPGPLSFLVDLEAVWATPRRFRIAGTDVRTTNPEVSLIHACLNAAVSPTVRLASLRDVVEASVHCDLERAEVLAADWRARAAVQSAAESIVTRLDLADHKFVSWASTLGVTAQDRKVMAIYRENRQSGALAAATVPYVPGLFGKARYLLALTLPSRRNRRHRGRSISASFRQAWRRAGELRR